MKSDENAMKNDSIKITREQNWIKSLKKDVYLHEATNVIGDM